MDVSDTTPSLASQLPQKFGPFTDSAYIHEHCGSGLARDEAGTFSINAA
jgi:hypothetical protein